MIEKGLNPRLNVGFPAPNSSCAAARCPRHLLAEREAQQSQFFVDKSTKMAYNIFHILIH
jgi:hypothetical protein